MAGRASIISFVRRLWPFLSLALLLAAIVVTSWAIGSPTLQRTVTEALIRVVIVVGLYIFIGNSGVVSFGSVAFMAIGAYASGWQTCCSNNKAHTLMGLPDFLRYHTYPLFPASLASGALAAVFALTVGIPIMRLSGIAAGIATLSVLAIVNVIYSNWDSVTLGSLSMVGIPLYVTMWGALAWAAVSILAAFLYQTSRPGIALRAASQDEVAARAAGIDVPRQRLLAWCLSAFFVGMGGVLYAHFLGVINVAFFYLNMTFITLAMLIVGGRKSLAGAVSGVIVLSAVAESFRQLEEGITIGSTTVSIPNGLEEVVVAVIMVVILILRPNGIMDGAEIGWPWSSKASSKSVR